MEETFEHHINCSHYQYLNRISRLVRLDEVLEPVDLFMERPNVFFSQSVVAYQLKLSNFLVRFRFWSNLKQKKSK